MTVKRVRENWQGSGITAILAVLAEVRRPLRPVKLVTSGYVWVGLYPITFGNPDTCFARVSSQATSESDPANPREESRGDIDIRGLTFPARPHVLSMVLCQVWFRLA